jgi:hypothetical protein
MRISKPISVHSTGGATARLIEGRDAPSVQVRIGIGAGRWMHVDLRPGLARDLRDVLAAAIADMDAEFDACGGQQ